jgi:hypothetical protein
MNQHVKAWSNADLYSIEYDINEYLQEDEDLSIAHINYQVSNGYHTVIVVFNQKGETK